MMLFFSALFFCLIAVSILWLAGERFRNASIIDAAWACLIMGCAWYYALNLPVGSPSRRFLMLMMVTLWALRLSAHIGIRLLHEKKEDVRYTKLREQWGNEQSFRMLRFFWIQAAAAALLSVSFLVVSYNQNSEIHGVEWIGFGLWGIAWLGEAAADYQLAAFKKNPMNKGKTCRTGLWNYSRHPNYFFEWLIWVSFFIFALGSPHGFWMVFFPVLMLHILRNVTGVPMAEKQSLASRGEDYRRYQSEVNIFFPWFPKRSA